MKPFSELELVSLRGFLYKCAHRACGRWYCHGRNVHHKWPQRMQKLHNRWDFHGTNVVAGQWTPQESGDLAPFRLSIRTSRGLWFANCEPMSTSLNSTTEHHSPDAQKGTPVQYMRGYLLLLYGSIRRPFVSIEWTRPFWSTLTSGPDFPSLITLAVDEPQQQFPQRVWGVVPEMHKTKQGRWKQKLIWGLMISSVWHKRIPVIIASASDDLFNLSCFLT